MVEACQEYLLNPGQSTFNPKRPQLKASRLSGKPGMQYLYNNYPSITATIISLVANENFLYMMSETPTMIEYASALISEKYDNNDLSMEAAAITCAWHMEYESNMDYTKHVKKGVYLSIGGLSGGVLLQLHDDNIVLYENETWKEAVDDFVSGCTVAPGSAVADILLALSKVTHARPLQECVTVYEFYINQYGACILHGQIA